MRGSVIYNAGVENKIKYIKKKKNARRQLSQERF